MKAFNRKQELMREYSRQFLLSDLSSAGLSCPDDVTEERIAQDIPFIEAELVFQAAGITSQRLGVPRGSFYIRNFGFSID